MAILTQATGEQTFYLGWYGMCPEGPGTTAETVNLLTSTYNPSGDLLLWGDGTAFHTKLAKITQIEAAEKGFGYFDQLGLDQWVSFGLSPEDYPGNSFTELLPGKAYLIVVRAAPGATGSIQSTINIPEFYWTKIGQPDSTYRLTDSCYG